MLEHIVPYTLPVIGSVFIAASPTLAEANLEKPSLYAGMGLVIIYLLREQRALKKRVERIEHRRGAERGAIAACLSHVRGVIKHAAEHENGTVILAKQIRDFLKGVEHEDHSKKAEDD